MFFKKKFTLENIEGFVAKAVRDLSESVERLDGEHEYLDSQEKRIQKEKVENRELKNKNVKMINKIKNMFEGE